ncbi:hypothetical protein FSOLCH5_001719 [Fusarium solani]
MPTLSFRHSRELPSIHPSHITPIIHVLTHATSRSRPSKALPSAAVPSGAQLVPCPPAKIPSLPGNFEYTLDLYKPCLVISSQRPGPCTLLSLPYLTLLLSLAIHPFPIYLSAVSALS